MLKRLLRWMLRIVVMFVVLVLIVAISHYVSHRYRPGSVLVLELDGPLAERGGYPVFGVLNKGGTSLNIIPQALKEAETDSRIAGLAIRVIDPEMELAQAQELSDAITEFGSHGKWTTAYMETAGESGHGNLPYLVASSADEVSMMPQGELNILGVGIREMFARGMLDWLHVTPNFASLGKYKSAANVFTEKDFTPAQREEDQALVSDMFNQIVEATARHRHLSADTVRELIDRAPLTAADGLKSHLLDRLEYQDQFDDRVKHYKGTEHELIDYDKYSNPQVKSPFGARNKIAVIYGVGAIERGASGYDPIFSPGSSSMGSDEMTAAFKDAREDDDVRAVVFRIDSPGGSVIASELIRRAVELCAKKKPVVVSMSGFAASGGFWVATPAARVYADPGTLTGSIGVLGGKFNVSGAAGALGVASGAITLGKNAEMYDSFTDFTPAQQQIFRDQILGDTYQYFLKLVAAQRHLTVEQVNDVAQGRVWSGEQAVKLKLIDQIGGFDAAMNEAKRLAKLDPKEPVEIVELPGRPGLLERLLSGHIYGQQGLEWPLPQALAPLLWMIRQSASPHGILGQAYCPLVPVI